MGPKKKSTTTSSDEKPDSTLPRSIEERLMTDQGLDFVIGVDEAGRGPLAGPVVAGACVFLTPQELIKGVKDSKQIDEKDREALYEILSQRENDIIWAVGEVDNHRIDEINILQSTFEAMTQAAESVIKKLSKTFKKAKFHILIDGNKIPPVLKEKYNCTAVVKGDGKEFIIGAASVFAKVTRDRLMYQQHEKYPQYNFAQHKGYGTASHFQAVYKHGPCEYHRFTFAPIKHMNLDKNNKLIKSNAATSSQNERKKQGDTKKKDQRPVQPESAIKSSSEKRANKRNRSVGATSSSKKSKSDMEGLRRSTRLRN